MFYRLMSLVLVAGILLGFARTWFLRWLDLPTDNVLHTASILHGVIGTTWFVLYLVQTWMARTHRRVHQTLGWAALVVVPGMVISGVLMAPQSALIFVSAAVTLLAGIAFRKRRDCHVRLMYLGSAALSIPGWDRLFWWELGGQPFDGVRYALPVLVLSLVARDVLAERRLHPATLIGGAICWSAPWVMVALR